jgi:hypothetical protein
MPVRTGPADWPLDTGCCTNWAQLDKTSRTRATAVATEILWALSGRRFGLWPVTVRPARPGCTGFNDPTDSRTACYLPWGSLIIPACGCTGGRCTCVNLYEVALPGPVHDITRVTIDGILVEAGTYLVYDHRWLVRVRNGVWPRCQDLSVPDDADGAFIVTYRRGIPVPLGGQWAAGQYACEVAKASLGDNTCRLPNRVASIVRQGVQTTYVDPTQLTRDGMTGIPEVDAWIRAVNPYRLTRDSVVWSPDLPRARRRTT